MERFALVAFVRSRLTGPGASRVALVVLLAPALASICLDVALRGGDIADFSTWQKLTYVAACSQSCCVWALLLWAVSQRAVSGWFAGGVFVLGMTFSLGGQAYFFEQYHAYLNKDLTLFAADLTDSVFSQLRADATSYATSKLPFFVLALGLVVLRCKTMPVARPRLAWLAPLLFVGSWFIPTQHRAAQASTPDTLYLNAIGAYVWGQLGGLEDDQRTRPSLRHSTHVAPIDARPAVPRNVVFVVSESVRADAFCSEFEPGCRQSPTTNELLPGRHGLRQMRALDSTTAISLPVLWAGVAPSDTHEVLHTWPLLFDYAKAAGWQTAYWTAQNLFFANSRLFVQNLGVDSFVSATQLQGDADLDMGADEARLADYVQSNVANLREPFFVVLHLANVHYPYFVDEHREQPHQPAAFEKGPDSTTKLRNYYQNAVVQQDTHLGRMIRAIRDASFGPRTVVMYTSDHGEAFREHGQMGHTFTLFDEEVKVPAFVDAPAGSLTQEERTALIAHRDHFTFHPDMMVTALDLMGVWDAPQLDPFRGKLLGASLLRRPAPARTLPMTNCAAVWSCAFENWGVMRGEIKLFARTPYDRGWQCFNTRLDPSEEQQSDDPLCDQLRGHVLNVFERPPK